MYRALLYAEGVNGKYACALMFWGCHGVVDCESIVTYTIGIQSPILIPCALHEASFDGQSSYQTSDTLSGII